MPVVGVNRDLLFQALGRTFSDEDFEDLCFQYGIELDDVTSERKMKLKELNQTDDTDLKDEEVIYRIDIPANRYDMLCLEGIARALNIFRGTLQGVDYQLADMNGRQLQQIVVKSEAAIVRPFIVAGILRGIKFDSHRYHSFIDLQDKLHQNLCRQRSLVSIGTHDLGKIQGPFTYTALPPQDIRFVPLKQKDDFNAKDLMQHYLEHDQKLKRYVPIIQDSLVYPVVLDANKTVLSLPPIINGSVSQISLDTRDVLVEVTATDLAKAEIVLNTVCTMFCEYCSTQYAIEPVEIVDSLGHRQRYPNLSPGQRQVQVQYINDCLGLDLDASGIASLLSRMTLRAAAKGQEVFVSIPPTRSDILHDADVMEDVAIAYGYNKMSRELPLVNTFGKELPLMQLTELLRQEIKDYTESLTWALCSRAENFGHLRQDDQIDAAVSIGNPATAEFEVCRTTLLPALLKTVAANKDASLPLKLFEISDVILIDSGAETGCRNERHLAAVHCSRETEFEVIHGFLNRIMELLDVPLTGQLAELNVEGVSKSKRGYEWKESDHATFFPGRHADILLDGKKVGDFGILHPDVLGNFDLTNPVTAIELNLEPFCFDQMQQPLRTHA